MASALLAVILLSLQTPLAEEVFPEEALLEEVFSEEWFQNTDDASISFMQSHSAMLSGPRQMLSQAAMGGLSDATSLAQGTIEVVPVARTTRSFLGGKSSEIEKVADAEQVPAAVVEPAWRVQEESEPEDMTCTLEGLTPGVCAMKALAQQPVAATEGSTDLDFFSPERLERALFSEIEAALSGTHNGFSDKHLAELEEAMSGFFSALPRNKDNRLEHPTVRYAVHQHFLREHAWYIRSLNPVGEAQTPASAGEALRGHVPEHLQSLLEKRAGGRGLGSRELAALVATLEHLIMGDMGERLKAAYAAHGLKVNSTASTWEVSEVLLTFMAHFLSLEHRSGYALTPEEARKERVSIESGYSAWSNVVTVVGKAVREAAEASGSALPFASALSAAKEVMSKFETISAQDCVDIKKDLSEMPDGTSGSVLLSDLHRKAVESGMLFAESAEYLATLGALDESKADSPRVLVPNYVYSPSNCLGTTSFFDMCCPNECEVLLASLEQQLRAPDVEPADVVTILESRGDGFALSSAALASLDDLAHARDGRVALHGLSFARWLHKAFPSECPRPRAEDFQGARGKETEVPAAEHEFQPVAKLATMVATERELLEELQESAVVMPSQNVSEDASFEDLKRIAAEKLGSSTRGLKVPSMLDVASFAQTDVAVESPASQNEDDVVESARASSEGRLQHRVI